MGTTRFKGENASERLSFSEISDSDMIQLRHKPGTEEDSDKGISKASLCSCPFGVSDTSASTAVKSAVLTDSNPDFNLVSGREVVVCFTTANTASSPSLNFAGSGSIPIYYPNGSVVGSWPANTWMHLKYFYATIGNTSIQRWILLSPLPVDTVALNNMHSVTSNAVAMALTSIKSSIDSKLPRLIFGEVDWNKSTHSFNITGKMPDSVYRPYRFYVEYSDGTDVGCVFGLLTDRGIKIVSTAGISGYSCTVSYSNKNINCVFNTSMASCNLYILADYN